MAQQTQPLLSYEDRSARDGQVGVVVQMGDGKGETARPRMAGHTPTAAHARSGPVLFLGFVGALITAAAIGLHYSGWEPVDLTFQDDKCWSTPNITLSGLPVDACLTRESAEQGTDCGEPAANRFCAKQGGNYHVNFTLAQVQSKLGTITLGNRFIGGQLGFGEVCCDVGRYEPAASRVMLLVGGIMLLYWLAALLAYLALGAMEVAAAWLELDAGEVLYFLLGMESPCRWVLFVSALLSWLKYVLWVVWCGQGVDCEAHGSPFRDQLLNIGEVLLLFSLGSFVVKAAPRIISVHYLYAGQFAHVRDTMRKESLLAALTRDEVRDIVSERQRQQRQQAAAASLAPGGGGGGSAASSGRSAETTTTSTDSSNAPPHHGLARRGGGAGPHGASQGGGRGGGHVSAAGASHHRRGGNTHHKGPGGGAHVGGVDLQSMLEVSGLHGGSGAVARFKTFLKHYSSADEKDLAEEAAAEGEVLFDNLVGAWDVNDDGAVGLHDFEELFRQVRPPPGFSSPEEAAHQAWEMFDLNMDGRLGRDEVVKALAAIYHDRANTARTVLSNESAVRSLEAAIGFVLYTLLLFAAANMLGLSAGGDEESQSSLDFFTTYVLALSFIFGDTVRSVFRSTLYLFAEQPFSVGDYIELEEELWCIESFDLIYTQLRKWEYNQYAKVPNDMLIDAKLVNVSRGGAFKDTVPLRAPLGMTMDSLKDLKILLVEAGDARPKDIVPGSPHVKVDSIESGQVMSLMIEWVYAFPPGDRQRVDDCREYMVARVKEALCAVGIIEQELNIGFSVVKKSKKKD